MTYNLARWLLDYAAALILFGAVGLLIADRPPPHVSIDGPPPAHRPR